MGEREGETHTEESDTDIREERDIGNETRK